MPLYEYKCVACGPFDVWRPLAESSDPLACETCQEPAIRVFSPPMVLSNGLSQARPASREPRLVQTEPREPSKPKLQARAGGRPWMIDH